MFLRGWGIFTTCVFNELLLGDVDDRNSGVGAVLGFWCCKDCAVAAVSGFLCCREWC